MFGNQIFATPHKFFYIKVISGSSSPSGSGPLSFFRQLRERQSAFTESAGSQLHSAQDNSHAKVAYFGVSYAASPQECSIYILNSTSPFLSK